MQLINGAVVKKSDLEKMDSDIVPSCKSIDFYLKCNNKDVYIYHKYTKIGGGHQDNQYDDLKQFIMAANSSTNRNIIFIAVADGNFYNSKNGKANTTKIQRLKDIANGKTTFAMTSKELPNFLETL